MLQTPESSLWREKGSFFSGNLADSANDANSSQVRRAIEHYISESYNSHVGPFTPESLIAEGQRAAPASIAAFNTPDGIAGFLTLNLANGLFPLQRGSAPKSLFIPTNDFSADAESIVEKIVEVSRLGEDFQVGVRSQANSSDIDLWLLSTPPTDPQTLFEIAALAISQLDADPEFLRNSIFSGAMPTRRMAPLAATALFASSGTALVTSLAQGLLRTPQAEENKPPSL